MEEKKSPTEDIMDIKRLTSIDSHKKNNPQKYIYILFSLILLCLIIPICLRTKNIKQIRNLEITDDGQDDRQPYSEITIKIKDIGIQTIIGSYELCPNEIYINGEKVGENICNVQLLNYNTSIKMIWFDKLTTCERMFYEMKNVTEIDLSKFDSRCDKKYFLYAL